VNRNLLSVILLAVILLVCAPLGVMGQAVYGSITGTVTDTNGAAVPAARVTITDTGKGSTFVT
jgi:hypothetical protein